jgi:hypothetical protein
MAGDASHPARYAFIEFETAEAAAAAFRLNGTQVLDRQLKYVCVFICIVMLLAVVVVHRCSVY